MTNDTRGITLTGTENLCYYHEAPVPLDKGNRNAAALRVEQL